MEQKPTEESPPATEPPDGSDASDDGTDDLDDLDDVTDVAGILQDVDSGSLAAYVHDTARPWDRRRDCARVLAGRGPEERVPDEWVPALLDRVCDPKDAHLVRIAALEVVVGRVPDEWVPALLDRVRDPKDAGGVRAALLDVYADHPELAEWLRHPDRAAERSYGMPETFLRARGRIGDLTAVPELVTLAHDPWRHTRAFGDEGLDALVARYGTATVLAEIGDARPEDRAYRLRTRHRAGEDVTDGLGDPDVGVAHLAHTLVDDPELVRRYLDRAPTTEAALWAACALDRLDAPRHEIRAIDDALGNPRVAVDGLDAEIRDAVVRRYGRGCQPRSDPRWRIEALCAPLTPPVDQDAQLRRATAALEGAGLEPEPPVSCGDHHQQGGGTYHVIRHGDVHVSISTLGRFASGFARDAAGREILRTCSREALEAAGFRWIDAAVGDVVVTDLCVYHFGDREPLDVYTLLFYWQD